MARERRIESADVEVKIDANVVEMQPQAKQVTLIPVRLKADSPVGRLVVGNVVIERSEPLTGWPGIPTDVFERLADEYGLEIAE